MTEEKVNLGEVPQRVGMWDAVHVAVIGAVTAHRMAPGSRVGLTESGELSMVASPVVGVVDPYLPPGEIPPGTTVWLCLLPGTVTGMRHVWSAPGFEVRPPAPESGPKKDPPEGFRFPEAARWSKLTADDKLEILKQQLAGKKTAVEIAKSFGVSTAAVYMVVKQYRDMKEAGG